MTGRKTQDETFDLHTWFKVKCYYKDNVTGHKTQDGAFDFKYNMTEHKTSTKWTYV